MPLLIALLVVVGVLAFGAGYIYDNRSVIVTLSAQPDDGECTAACHAMEVTRSTLIDTRNQIAERQRMLGPLTTQLGAAQLAALALLAAAAIAAVIPFLGAGIASALLTAYAAAQAYVLFVLGRHMAATEGVRALMAQRDRLEAEDRKGLERVREKCPPERAEKCIAELPTFVDTF